MLPVTDEQAKAIQKASELGTTVVQEIGQLARYIADILGTAPKDAVGIILGDPLQQIRTIIAEKLFNRVREIRQERGVEMQEAVSPSLAIPLIRAAYDESSPELQEIWARLIAAATDPSRKSRVRKSFIETVKRFDPLDALVLHTLYKSQGTLMPNTREYLAQQLQVTANQIVVSAQNLGELRCAIVGDMRGGGELVNFFISVYGRELMQACF